MMDGDGDKEFDVDDDDDDDDGNMCIFKNFILNKTKFKIKFDPIPLNIL